MAEWLYGRNAVFESLRASRREFFKLQIVEGIKQQGKLEQILAYCSQNNIPVEQVRRSKLDASGVNHQGVSLRTSVFPYSSLAEITKNFDHETGQPLILVLDSLNDPQNLGTLLRTAEVVGVDGVLLPLRRTATVTPAVVNASSGATEHLQIAQTNLAQGLISLKSSDVWIMGLENSPNAQDINQADLDLPLALVVGSESAGMRSLVRKSCDHLLKLPMKGKIESLNASVAGSIALYIAWQQRIK